MCSPALKTKLFSLGYVLKIDMNIAFLPIFPHNWYFKTFPIFRVKTLTDQSKLMLSVLHYPTLSMYMQNLPFFPYNGLLCKKKMQGLTCRTFTSFPSFDLLNATLGKTN